MIYKQMGKGCLIWFRNYMMIVGGYLLLGYYLHVFLGK